LALSHVAGIAQWPMLGDTDVIEGCFDFPFGHF
jgi:hypothetical protein